MRQLVSFSLMGFVLSACASYPPVELSPKGRTPAPLDSSRPSQASVLEQSTSAREVIVDARSPRTEIGRVRAGERVRIKVLSGGWNHDPSFSLAGSEGIKELCSSFGGHRCIAGHQVAPMMGLVLLTRPLFSPPAAPPACPITERMFAPTGLEMEAPDEIDLFLGPNDQEDGLSNNQGSLDVEVEISASKAAKTSISKEIIHVDATVARTSAGHVSRGQYVRITPKKGKWSHDPTRALVDAAGNGAERCADGSGGRCLAGSQAAPLMGLMVLVGRCNAAPLPRPEPALRAEYIPWGKDFVATEDVDLFLAPNDWEDGLFNNSGSVRVRVDMQKP